MKLTLNCILISTAILFIAEWKYDVFSNLYTKTVEHYQKHQDPFKAPKGFPRYNHSVDSSEYLSVYALILSDLLPACTRKLKDVGMEQTIWVYPINFIPRQLLTRLESEGYKLKGIESYEEEFLPILYISGIFFIGDDKAITEVGFYYADHGGSTTIYYLIKRNGVWTIVKQYTPYVA